MSIAPFQIDGHTFALSSDLLESQDFVIRSVPWNYRVHALQQPPAVVIQELLDQDPGNVLLIDKNVHELYGAPLELDPDRIVVATATEEYKTLSGGVLPFIDFLARRGITKADKIIAVGGGIIQDVAAYAACTYKRGIPFVFLPTTLLAMCDSCIGGKTGINYNGAKNQLALFSAPKEVLILPEFLATLPSREIGTGFGEILKLHITGGSTMLERYQKMERAARAPLEGAASAELISLILGSLAVKKLVIEEDEFELNLRKSLNYGHTVGHAIESLSDYAIPHGHAVTIGMLIVNELAARRGRLSEAEKCEIERLGLELLDETTLAELKKLSIDELTDRLRKDKKALGGSIQFVMIGGVGNMLFVKLANDHVLADEIREITHDLASRT